MNRRAPEPFFKSTADRDYGMAVTLAFGLTFIVGCMCGATIAMGLGA